MFRTAETEFIFIIEGNADFSTLHPLLAYNRKFHSAKKHGRTESLQELHTSRFSLVLKFVDGNPLLISHDANRNEKKNQFSYNFLFRVISVIDYFRNNILKQFSLTGPRNNFRVFQFQTSSES